MSMLLGCRFVIYTAMNIYLYIYVLMCSRLFGKRRAQPSLLKATIQHGTFPSNVWNFRFHVATLNFIAVNVWRCGLECEWSKGDQCVRVVAVCDMQTGYCPLFRQASCNTGIRAKPAAVFSAFFHK